MTATPFTAEDVKFTIELINNPDFRAGRRAGHELVRDIEVVSPTELTWRLEKPYAPYPAILSWTFIVPKHILGKEADPNTSSFNTAPVGTGPFKWVERVAGRPHRAGRHSTDYFGEGPYLERLIFKYIPDMTVLYTQFQTGDVDYTGIQGISRRPLRRGQGPRRPRSVAGAAAVHREHRLQSRAARVPGQGGARRALHGPGQGKPDPGASITACRRRRNRSCPGELGLQSQSTGPQLRPGEGQADPRGSRLEARLRRRAREERRPARVHQLDHGRQPHPRAGTAIAAADLGRDRRQDVDQQPAARGDVGRLLDDVEVRDRDGRHRLRHRPGPRRQRLLLQQVDRRQGRHRSEHDAVRQPRGRQAAGGGRDGRRPGASARRSTRRCRRSPATICPTCRSSSTRWSRASRTGLQNFTPNVAVQENSWNAGQWYWAN